MLDDEAHGAGGGDAEHACNPERLTVVDHQRVGEGRAEHEDGAVREVQDVEDSEDERIADGEKSVNGPDEDRV